MSRQRILVVGAGGFIGRHIIEQLSATTWAHPIAAGRNITRVVFSGPVEKIRLDATNPVEVQRVLEQVDAVISCVAGSARSIVTSGRLLLESAARRATPPKVVWLSSIAAYGSATGAIDEGGALLGDLGAYSAAKAEIDTLAAHLPFVIRLRPGIVYGPESPWWSDRIARLLVHRRLGDLGEEGDGICNLVHVRDVAGAALQSLRIDSALGEAFNLGDPSPPTWNGYFAQYATALEALPLRRISGTRVVLELNIAAPLLKLAELLPVTARRAADYPALRPWLITLCRHRIQLKVDKAEDLLGIRWLPLSAGLEHTAAWFRADGRTG